MRNASGQRDPITDVLEDIVRKSFGLNAQKL
jgi:hypothetical protein